MLLKKLLFIFNPATSGGKLKHRLMDIVCSFSDAGYEMCVWPTHAVGDARTIAAQHASEADLVVCCGGDGTLNEVIDGLITLDSRPPIGYIPGGTTCDFAASLHLPKNNMLAATRRIISPKKHFFCDVGRLNERTFSYVAAFGNFTDISYKTPQVSKNIFGYFAYVLEGMLRLPKLTPFHAKIECDEGEFEDDFLLGMIANSASVAGFTMPSKMAVRMDDGLFELLLVKHPQNLADIGELSAAMLGGNPRSPLLVIKHVKRAVITSDEKTPWTLDGEYGGAYSEANFTVMNKAIEICI